MKSKFSIYITYILGGFLFAQLIISCSHEQVNINQKTKDASLRYAQGSQKALSKGLMGAIKAHDIPYAISFCKDTAELLTQSMSNILNAKIRRVSDKNRNPNNAANEAELSYITSAKKLMEQKKKVNPRFFRSQDKAIAYIPIITKPFCLNCHGAPVNMNMAVKQKLKALYPDDKAINYKEKELRGIWVVEMKELSD